MTSESSYRTTPCEQCGRPREWWRLDMPGTNHAMAWNNPMAYSEQMCAPCYRAWIERPAAGTFGGLIGKREMYGKGHYITAVDGSEHYHEDWVKNKVYKKFEEYERTVRAPSMKIAQDSYKKLETFKEQPKERPDGMSSLPQSH